MGRGGKYWGGSKDRRGWGQGLEGMGLKEGGDSVEGLGMVAIQVVVIVRPGGHVVMVVVASSPVEVVGLGSKGVKIELPWRPI